MKSRTTVITLAFLASMAFIVGTVMSQDHGGAKVPSAEEQAEMMAKWMKVATPGKHHKQLEYFVGNWKATTRMWMGGPGTPPEESSGTAQYKSILGGRFVMQEYHGQMMGQPFEGIALFGFDNYKKMFTSVWADTSGTQLLTSLGAPDPSGKVFRYYGQMDEPMLDMQDRMVKYVTRIINNDKFVFEIYDLAAGDDYKVFEIVYSRQR